MVKKSLSVKNFNLWFADKHILKDISFSVPQNKVTAIIGPSGCGKSTLLRSINRMNDLIDSTKINGNIYIDQGKIYSDKIDLSELQMKIGMVFQKPNPFPKSIYNNVAYGLKIKGVKKNKIDEIVEKSLKDAWLWDEVKNRMDNSALDLSGGQQQRLCIARALATNPEILLLDEPTSALDPKSTSKIEELVLDLKETVTVLQVTHNISQAARISDFTAFLYLGELIEFGETERVFTVPQDKKTEEYIEGKFG